MPDHTDEERRKNSERFANISEADLNPDKAKEIIKEKGTVDKDEKPKK